VLLPKGSCAWRDELQPGITTVMGRAIGELAAPGE
jgi:hypothetical protein